MTEPVRCFNATIAGQRRYPLTLLYHRIARGQVSHDKFRSTEGRLCSITLYAEFKEKSTGTIDAIRTMDKARNSAYYGAKIGI